MNLYFKERENKLLFAPWGFLMMLGACWVVQVPSSASSQRLYRMVAWFNIAVIAVLVLGITVARLADWSVVNLVGGGWLAAVILYSICAMSQMVGWRKVPVARAMQCIVPVGDHGNVILYRQVAFGLVACALTIGFLAFEFVPLAFCVIMLVNSVMAGLAVLKRNRTSIQTEGELE